VRERENIEKTFSSFFLYENKKKKYRSKKKELFIKIFRISIRRFYYNDAFTPYEAQLLNPLCVGSHHYSGNEKCTRRREGEGEKEDGAL
jgi:hypothetical protein